MLVQVIEAYKTDHFPLDGNLAEEVLVLSTGQALYLNPAYPDALYHSKAEAFAVCVGTPEFALGLLQAWSDGYDL